jgi:hypothetical protein
MLSAEERSCGIGAVISWHGELTTKLKYEDEQRNFTESN